MDKIQERGVDLALRGHNILLTGFPGTRKSFTFIEMVRQLKAIGINVVVTATTGIASQGQDGRYDNDELLNLIVHDENFVDIKNNIKAMNTLIIDEISMLSSKLLEQYHISFNQPVHLEECK
jgi:DNA replication protein DnaC